MRRSLLLLQYYDNNKRLGAELLKEEKRISFLFFSPLSRIKLWTRKDWHKKRCHTHRGRERDLARVFIYYGPVNNQNGTVEKAIEQQIRPGVESMETMVFSSCQSCQIRFSRSKCNHDSQRISMSSFSKTRPTIFGRPTLSSLLFSSFHSRSGILTVQT